MDREIDSLFIRKLFALSSSLTRTLARESRGLLKGHSILLVLFVNRI